MVPAIAQSVSNDAGGQSRADKAQDKPKDDATPLALKSIQDEINRIARAIEAQKDEAEAKTKNEREESDLQAQWQMARWAENMFWIALGSLALTVVGIFLLWRTLHYTKKAVEEAGAATKAANAAVEVTNMAAQAQLRAYVCNNGAVIGKAPRNKDKFSVVVELKNTGVTPAYDLISWADIAYLEYPLESSLRIHCLMHPNRGVLAPGGISVIVPTHKRLTEPEQQLIRDDKMALYLFGEVHYRDGFAHQRMTQFRLRLHGQGLELGAFKADAEGNYAD